MMTGLPPFYDENTNEMYKKILQQPLTFPSEMSPLAQDILSKVKLFILKLKKLFIIYMIVVYIYIYIINNR